MPNVRASDGLASTSTVARRKRPSYSSASRSSIGLRIRHGWHHPAQKSTTTGRCRDPSTTWSWKSCSPTATTLSIASTIASTAQESPRGEAERDAAIANGQPAAESLRHPLGQVQAQTVLPDRPVAFDRHGDGTTATQPDGDRPPGLRRGHEALDQGASHPPSWPGYPRPRSAARGEGDDEIGPLFAHPLDRYL